MSDVFVYIKGDPFKPMRPNQTKAIAVCVNSQNMEVSVTILCT
jgi:hypothetical protein